MSARFAAYSDLNNEVYTLTSLAAIAETIWRGQRRNGFVRNDTYKWCDATAVSVNMRKAWFVTTAAEWKILSGYTDISLGNGLTIYIETNCRGDFAGRFHVKKENYR